MKNILLIILLVFGTLIFAVYADNYEKQITTYKRQINELTMALTELQASSGKLMETSIELAEQNKKLVTRLQDWAKLSQKQRDFINFLQKGE